MKPENLKIDLVYLWVDGNSPKFIQEKNFWMEKLNIKHNKDNDDTRYVDNQELRYSIRSVIKNAPWINKIYIVTNGQIPSWLDLEKTDKIKIVSHEDIIPSKYLPTFNSRAIESFVADIPDLSEHFLLANDDCFINKPVSPDFFFDKNGTAIVRFLKHKFTYKMLKRSQYRRSIYYTRKLFFKKYGKINEYVPHHNIDAYNKSAYKECIEVFKDEFEELRNHKFRQKSIQRIAFALYLTYVKNAKAEIIEKKHNASSLFIDIAHYAKMQKQITCINPTLLCINDDIHVKKNCRKEIKDFMEYLYPYAQVWEKEGYDSINHINLQKYKKNEKTYTKILLQDFINSVFSVSTRRQHKIIKILGLNISFSLHKQAEKNYKKVLKRLKKKFKDNSKINVIFLTNESSKWGYDSLYRIFEKSGYFDVKIVNLPLIREIYSKEDIKQFYLDCEFYKKHNYNVQPGFVDEKFIDLKKLKPDIVFHEQPYGYDKKYKPYKISKYALTCYCSYGYEIFEYKANYTNVFHRYLYKYFVEHDMNTERYELYREGNSKNCVAVGYPNLDAYINNLAKPSEFWNDYDKFKIIYAPHYTFGERTATGIGTFLQNYDFILNFAKNHPETTWLFKPHPRLKYQLTRVEKVWTEEQWNNYEKEWQKYGKVCEEGNYIDIFATSDLMITDCGSFLAEYLPSGKPFIRLCRENCIEMNKLGEKIISEYYFSHNNNELEQLLNEIVVNKNDYKKEERLKLIPEIIDFNKSCAEKIYEYIINLLEEKNNA